MRNVRIQHHLHARGRQAADGRAITDRVVVPRGHIEAFDQHGALALQQRRQRGVDAGDVAERHEEQGRRHLRQIGVRAGGNHGATDHVLRDQVVADCELLRRPSRTAGEDFDLGLRRGLQIVRPRGAFVARHRRCIHFPERDGCAPLRAQRGEQFVGEIFGRRDQRGRLDAPHITRERRGRLECIEHADGATRSHQSEQGRNRRGPIARHEGDRRTCIDATRVQQCIDAVGDCAQLAPGEPAPFELDCGKRRVACQCSLCELLQLAWRLRLVGLHCHLHHLKSKNKDKESPRGTRGNTGREETTRSILPPRVSPCSPWKSSILPR